VDDSREMIPTDFIASEVNNPGLYTDFCTEIDLGLLALNTICASDELKNIDKEASKLVDAKYESTIKFQ
jgi:DNA polymerase epsilon subunit 1